MRHNGPIHKIVFDFSEEVLEFIFPKEFDYEDIDNLLSDNLNQWFLLVTQNSVEEIDISYSIDIELLTLNPEDFVLMEELSSVARTLKMLHTLKFIHFNGSRSEMQSIKVLLACFPGIKKVVIVREDFVLMEELSSVARTLKMLRTLKFSPFFGSRSQMQSIKALLACFPEIKKVVIVRDWIDRFRPDEKFKIKQELLDFSRASTKPEIFYV
nr:F-box/FBD/LRR-repeat protein At1g13570-like isoform X1 [Ipomoea batatas]